MARPLIVIVGAGFAGFHAARRLTRRARGAADIVAGEPDRLLPVPAAAAGGGRRRARPASHRGAAGRDTARRPARSSARSTAIDVDGRGRLLRRAGGRAGRLRVRPAVLAAGSVNKLLPIPGVADHAHGFRGLAEALYLRDHLVRQLELADDADDPAERGRALHVRRGRRRVHRHRGRRAGPAPDHDVLATAPRPERQPVRAGCCSTPPTRSCRAWTARMSGTADRVLRRRGVDVRTGTSVRRGDRGRRQAHRRQIRADPHPRLVRRRPAGPARREHRAAHDQGPARGRRVPRRARSSRRSWRAATPRPCPTPSDPGEVDGDDRAARRPAGGARRATTSPPSFGDGGAGPTGTRTSASSSTSAAARRRRTRSASRCPGSPPGS